jgi:hypothetical protein
MFTKNINVFFSFIKMQVTKNRMKIYLISLTNIIIIWIDVLSFSTSFGQQFNSDNYLSKPHGVATIILTTGQRNTMLMNTFSLFPNWEFTFAAYIYNNDNDRNTDDGYSASLYAKYMFYENKAKTGGFAAKLGTGLDPGYLDGSDRVKDAFKTYWMNAPVTFPFFKNKLSWDLMPGVSVTRHYGEADETAWAFTYSTRLAYYPFNPYIAIVGEIYGSEGQVKSIPEYRVGLRWEPNQYANLALTFDDEFKGTNGAGFEIGLMLFTPPFIGGK